MDHPRERGEFMVDDVTSGRWVGWWRDEATGKDVKVREWDFAEGKVHEIEITLPK